MGQLGKVNEKAGQSLADPADYPNLFPDYQASLQAQQMLARERANVIPASDFKDIVPNHERNPLEELSALADEEGEPEKSKHEPLANVEADEVIEEESKVSGISTDDLEAELEMDLDNLKLDDIDTTDVNLDDEDLLED